MIPRITLSNEAEELIETLKEKHGRLMFHQSGGCCDGSQPMCFEWGDFILGSNDVCLGKIEDCEFWMSNYQFEYWKYTHLHIDVTKGRGSSFSLEIPLGLRFIIHSRMFTQEELQNLEPISYAD